MSSWEPARPRFLVSKRRGSRIHIYSKETNSFSVDEEAEVPRGFTAGPKYIQGSMNKPLKSQHQGEVIQASGAAVFTVQSSLVPTPWVLIPYSTWKSITKLYIFKRPGRGGCMFLWRQKPKLSTALSKPGARCFEETGWPANPWAPLVYGAPVLGLQECSGFGVCCCF